jgi:hypothetical protein
MMQENLNFGVFVLVIQWMHKEITLRNFTLQPMFNKVQSTLPTFSKISLSCINKDRNMIANELSKNGIELDRGT